MIFEFNYYFCCLLLLLLILLFISQIHCNASFNSSELSFYFAIVFVWRFAHVNSLKKYTLLCWIFRLHFHRMSVASLSIERIFCEIEKQKQKIYFTDFSIHAAAKHLQSMKFHESFVLFCFNRNIWKSSSRGCSFNWKIEKKYVI